MEGETSSRRLIKYGIEALLFLGKEPAVKGSLSGFLFIYGFFLYFELQFCFQRFVKLVLIGTDQSVRAKSFLKEAGSGLSSVFIIAVGDKGIYHGLDMAENILRRHLAGDTDAEERLHSKAACGIHVKGSVRLCHKAEITEGGMSNV